MRFGRGVSARTTQAMLGLLLVWCIVAWRWTDNLIGDAGLLIVGLAASIVFLLWSKSLQKFAKENPAQAMLEGAEFLEYAKFEASAKGEIISGRQQAPLIPDPRTHAPEPPEDKELDA